MPRVGIIVASGLYALLLHRFLSSRARWWSCLGMAGAPPPPGTPGILRARAVRDGVRADSEDAGGCRLVSDRPALDAGLTLRYALTHPPRVHARLLTNSSTACSTHDWLQHVRSGAYKLIAAVRRDGVSLGLVAVHSKNARRVALEYQRALCANFRAPLFRAESASGSPVMFHCASLSRYPFPFPELVGGERAKGEPAPDMIWGRRRARYSSPAAVAEVARLRLDSCLHVEVQVIVMNRKKTKGAW